MTILETRKKLCLTQSQMAKLMGMDQPSLARIEAGTPEKKTGRVRRETRQHLAFLDVLAYLHECGKLQKFLKMLGIV